MAKPRKRPGSKLWFCEVRRKGHPAQRASFPVHADAVAWIRNTEKSLDDGQHLSTRTQTLAWLIKQYRKKDEEDEETTKES